MHPFNFEFIFQVLILKLIICCLHTKGPNIHSYWCQIQELKVKLQQNVKVNEQFHIFSEGGHVVGHGGRHEGERGSGPPDALHM